jgi:NRAMP (natural resistance-associated macrophage protein)-like metal ion transporter
MTNRASKPSSNRDVKQPERPKLFEILGPGLITGASDDDPSGIATYSQAGAQFGVNLGWTLILTFPLMCAIQQISAQIGRVTGFGLGGNLRRQYPKAVLYGLVGLLLVANTINLGADLGAMAAALTLLLPGSLLLYVAGFGAMSILLEIFVRYSRYVSILKWLSLSLFAYVATVFAVRVSWSDVAYHLIVPQISWNAGYLTVVVAVFGTTISPYLFFWQAGEEVENEKEDPKAKPLKRAPNQAPRELQRIRYDTWIGMAFSNVIALCIVFTTAATLHAHGITNIQTSSQAAEALRPIAGAIRVYDICARDHRHRSARVACLGGIGCICGRRSLRLARRISKKTKPGEGILWDDCGGQPSLAASSISRHSIRSRRCFGVLLSMASSPYP